MSHTGNGLLILLISLLSLCASAAPPPLHESTENRRAVVAETAETIEAALIRAGIKQVVIPNDIKEGWLEPARFRKPNEYPSQLTYQATETERDNQTKDWPEKAKLFWLKNIELVGRTLDQLVKDYPQLKSVRHQIEISFTAFTPTPDDYDSLIGPEEMRSLPRLRQKLLRLLLERYMKGDNTSSLLRKQLAEKAKEESLNLFYEGETSAFPSISRSNELSKLFGRLDEMAHSNKPPYFAPSPTTVPPMSASRATQREWQQLASEYPEAANTKLSEEAFQRMVSLTKGRLPDRATPNGIQGPLFALLQSFSNERKATHYNLWAQFASHYLATVEKPEAYRTLRVGERRLGVVQFSHAYLLDSFEEKLTKGERALFSNLRTKYRLTSAELNEAEAGELHGESQYNMGGGFLAEDKTHNSPSDWIEAAGAGTMPKVIHVTPNHGGWYQQRIPAPEEFGGLQKLAELARRSDTEHSYNVERNFLDYAGVFPPSFAEALSKLDGNSHVIDMGSGEGLFVEGLVNPTPSTLAWKEQPDPYVFRDEDEKSERARLNHFSELWQAKKERPFATGITLKMKREAPKDRDMKLGFHSDYLENLSDTQITRNGRAGKADVIVDLYGVFSYAPDTSAVLRRYMKLLKPNGKIFIFGSVKPFIIHPDGSRTTLLDFIAKEIPGLKVTQHGPKEKGHLKVLEIERDPTHEVEIPNLTLKLRGTEDPPLMIYEVSP